MNRSYRNTVEIAEYANQLAGIQDMELFERHGRPVEESSFPDRESALDQVLEIWKEASSRFETAALVFLTEKEARYAASYLKEKINADSATENTDKEAVSVSYLDRNSQTFHKGLTVTTFYLAKGLEFDQVVSVYTVPDSIHFAKEKVFLGDDFMDLYEDPQKHRFNEQIF